jgi:pyruvate ferredoxin oxidoreductase beta subunit
VDEAEYGEVTSTLPIRGRVPVEEYLRPQRRYAHLFAGAGRPDTVSRLQAIADRNIARYGLLPEEAQA